MINPFGWIGSQIVRWLTDERPLAGTPQCNFDRLSFEMRPCDVLLVEGRSRVSDVIKTITQSQWTHAVLYIGRLHDIEDETTREHVSWLYDGDPNDQLIIEPMLGKGTIVSPLNHYVKDHVRICRPTGLSRSDARRVVGFAAKHLGRDYDVRQILDLGRFLLPYSFLPRRWRSSLFEHNIGPSARTVCSTMIAAAFSSVQFPIMPVVHRSEDGKVKFYKRNTRLYVPRDFDTSPYFEIIKYPILGLDDLAVYRRLPWDTEGVICNDENECFIPGENGAAPIMVTDPAGKPEQHDATDEPDPLKSKPATPGGL